jgi:hypothetical protein
VNATGGLGIGAEAMVMTTPVAASLNYPRTLVTAR